MPSSEKLKQKWSKDATKQLAGKVIKEVRWMTEEEVQASHWGRSAPVIVFDDGDVMYPMQDDEGNGPGALMLNKPKNDFILPVI